MELSGNRKLFLLGAGVVIALLIAGGAWISRFQKGYEGANKQGETREQPRETPIQTSTTESRDSPEKVSPAPVAEDSAELYKTETVICNDESYIFDTVSIKNKGYFNYIYKSDRSSENLFVAEDASGKEDLLLFFEKKLWRKGLGALRILAVPGENCDRVYLTRYVPETDAPATGLFEWRIGEKEVRQLAISEEFRSDFIPDYSSGQWKNAISPDGKKIIVAQPPDKSETSKWSRWSCNFRILRLLNLQKDASELLTQLPETQTFDSGRTEVGNCTGVKIGWINAKTISYDIYDVTSDNIPFLERKTLIIKQ